MSLFIQALAKLNINDITLMGDDPVNEAEYLARVTGDNLPSWETITKLYKEIEQDNLITAIKTECAKRIEALAPLWKQSNALADSQNEVLGQEEREEAKALLLAVKALRDKSNQLEEKAKKGKKFDAGDDGLWV